MEGSELLLRSDRARRAFVQRVIVGAVLLLLVVLTIVEVYADRQPWWPWNVSQLVVYGLCMLALGIDAAVSARRASAGDGDGLDLDLGALR